MDLLHCYFKSMSLFNESEQKRDLLEKVLINNA